MPRSAGDEEREKVTFRLPARLRRDLKARAAVLGIDIQDAVPEAIRAWRAASTAVPTVDTSGAEPFSTFLPVGLDAEFKADCSARGATYIQGLAQAVTSWLDAHPSAQHAQGIPQRKIVINQKGGVGKTAVAAGTGEALAEAGARVLLIDYDPQGHLSTQLNVPRIQDGQDSLAGYMTGDAKGSIQDLIVVLPHGRFGGRLHVLPTCTDAFLLDVRLSQVRNRERALERALAPIEDQYDVIIVDCPPSLGLSVDAAIYFGRQRDGEADGVSGALIPVWADDSSADAFRLLIDQIDDLCKDMGIKVRHLGLVVNMYDPRRGYIATSSLAKWRALGYPPVAAVIGDLKEQREAVRKHQPLLDYKPDCGLAHDMRELARSIS